MANRQIDTGSEDLLARVEDRVAYLKIDQQTLDEDALSELAAAHA